MLQLLFIYCSYKLIAASSLEYNRMCRQKTTFLWIIIDLNCFKFIEFDYFIN